MTQASAHQWERVQSVASNPSHPDSYLAACLLEVKENAVSKEQLLASSQQRKSLGLWEKPPGPIASDDEIYDLYHSASTLSGALRAVYGLGREHGSL
jgi:hypothetical protein